MTKLSILISPSLQCFKLGGIFFDVIMVQMIKKAKQLVWESKAGNGRLEFL